MTAAVMKTEFINEILALKYLNLSLKSPRKLTINADVYPVFTAGGAGASVAAGVIFMRLGNNKLSLFVNDLASTFEVWYLGNFLIFFLLISIY